MSGCPLCANSGLTHRNKKHRYSITSSASASSVGGISTPSAFAVLCKDRSSRGNISRFAVAVSRFGFAVGTGTKALTSLYAYLLSRGLGAQAWDHAS